MIRSTSVETYRRIRDDGLLSKKRMEVYDVLFRHGPLTATQVAQKMPGHKSQSVGANVHARLGELRATGCVAEVGETECPVTGNRVLLWDVTKDLPVKPVKVKKEACRWCGGRGYLAG